MSEVAQPFRDRLGWGLRWGAYYALVLSAWVLFLYLIKGSAPFEREGVTLWGVLVLYVVAAPMAGLVVGALLPLVRWRLGAIVTGVLAAVPISFGAVIALEGLYPWTKVHTFATSMMSLVGGGMGGLVFRELFCPKPRSRG